MFLESSTQMWTSAQRKNSIWMMAYVLGRSQGWQYEYGQTLKGRNHSGYWLMLLERVKGWVYLAEISTCIFGREATFTILRFGILMLYDFHICSWS
jgi:hypothetical protein